VRRDRFIGQRDDHEEAALAAFCLRALAARARRLKQHEVMMELMHSNDEQRTQQIEEPRW
jgi:hypothetical protein